MPDITDTTPREDYTIAGKTFSIPQPYAEGHALTAGEASQLNQVFAENARNNFAKRVKDAVEADSFDQDSMQLALDDYLNEYEMGVRTGGGRIGDPVEAEAMSIAKEQVRKALVKKGYKLKDAKTSQITELAKKVLAGDKGEAIRAIARTRVEAAQELDLGDVEVSEPEAEEEAPPAPRGRKAQEPVPAEA